MKNSEITNHTLFLNLEEVNQGLEGLCENFYLFMDSGSLLSLYGLSKRNPGVTFEATGDMLGLGAFKRQGELTVQENDQVKVARLVSGNDMSLKGIMNLKVVQTEAKSPVLIKITGKVFVLLRDEDVLKVIEFDTGWFNRISIKEKYVGISNMKHPDWNDCNELYVKNSSGIAVPNKNFVVIKD